MVRGIRTAVGIVSGACAAFAVLRVRRAARKQGRSFGAVLPELPSLLHRDIERVTDATRLAIADGKSAAEDRRDEIEQVFQGQRLKPEEQ